MSITEGLNTKTALEHLIFLSDKNIITVCRELGITPQQFSDWIKLRRPIPSERLRQIEAYFNVPADSFTDERRFAKRLSRLGSVNLELIVASSGLNPDMPLEYREELEYRISNLTSERERQLRIARLSALLERRDATLMKKIDAFLDELEENK